MDEDRWLSYARNLGFPDAHYEEAVKLIGIPDSANRLVGALIDVSSRQSSSITSQNSSQTYSSDLSPLAKEDRSDSLTTTTSTTTLGSSCYSSIASLPSPSSNRSLDAISQPENLKKVFIDGPNVARSHGKDAAFSWPGIKICVDWFLARGHRVKVFVPSYRCQLAEPSIVDHLTEHDALIKTPDGCNDDLFVIEAAVQSDAIIVSNDLFRDESRFNAYAKNFIRSHRLPYIFVDDLFIPAKDPLGNKGPNLDEFLSNQPQKESFHSKLTRAKSHQRNGPPMRQHPPSSHHRSLQASRSLPLQTPRLGAQDSI